VPDDVPARDPGPGGPSAADPPAGDARPAVGRPFVEPVVVRPLAVAPVLGALAFGWLGLRSDNPWLLLLACAAVGPFLVSWVGRPRLEAVGVASGLPPRAVVGEAVAWTAVVRNTGRRTSPPLLLTDRVAGYPDASVVVEPVPAGGTAHVTLRRTASRRAFATGHEITLATTAPFGMVERRRVLANDRLAAVHPAPGRAAEVVARGGDGDDPAGAAARTGPDLHAVREWRPGDEARHVHWRSTARHGRLVVVEPERTLSRRLAVVVAGEPSSPGWEDLLARVAGTVVVAARTDREMLVLARDVRAARYFPDRTRRPGPDDAAPSFGPAAGVAAGSGDAAAAGLAAVVSRDAADLFDLLAALDAVTAPDGDDLRRVARWAGPGSDVVVATTRPLEAGWWADVGARAAAAGVRLSVLDATPQGAGHGVAT
jgi:hypothetical protein